MHARNKCDMPALVRSDTTSGDGSLAGDYTSKTTDLLRSRVTSFIGERITWLVQRHAIKPGTSRSSSPSAGAHAAVLCSAQVRLHCQRSGNEARRPSRTAAAGRSPGDAHRSDDCRDPPPKGCCQRDMEAINVWTDGRLCFAGVFAAPLPLGTP